MVCDARIPSFSLLAHERPATLRHDERRLAAVAEVGVDRGDTTVTSAIPPFVMKTLVPFRTTHRRPALAVVRSERTSDPELGSVTA